MTKEIKRSEIIVKIKSFHGINSQIWNYQQKGYETIGGRMDKGLWFYVKMKLKK